MYEVTVDPHRNTLPPLPSCLLARRPTREATVLCHNLKPTFPVIMPIYILSDCIAGKCLAPSYTAFATCDLEAGYLRSRSRLRAIQKQATCDLEAGYLRSRSRLLAIQKQAICDLEAGYSRSRNTIQLSKLQNASTKVCLYRLLLDRRYT
jgi:hypothetical protein